jgi:hypothetical protein
MEKFKTAYDKVMTKATLLSKKIIKEDSFVSEYACAM